ncbi:MAG: glucose dehydrogenase [Pirellulaceae bacterium]|nr:MAG: glucose dehydrogenase [Pirellulaceae bacterium]
MIVCHSPRTVKHPSARVLCWLVVLLLVIGGMGLHRDGWAQENNEPLPPNVAAASDEGELAMRGFQLAEGLQVNLFAAEPQVANPVAFWIADSGKVYVCETFRQGTGVVDNRSYDNTWVDRDLATQTIEDRLRYHEELLGEAIKEFTRHDDRIRVLVDENGDGQVDRAVVFADHFNDVLDGTGAGVLEHNGNVFYTCIPNLYLLRDEDGDLRADVRQVLYTGFGLRVAFRGHDLHGLTIGPDGRLYFSIGDRGANVPVDGGRLTNIESGCVFRCELDGSDLQIFATGLRNPQELAFDKFGNLFTGDNNSDSGDKARWVYVLEGGDSGWRMAYQYLPDRGPFNRQRLWEPFHEGQPAYIVPPVANIADGPSGLDYYPGTGFGNRFDDQFFLADFRGTASRSGIRTIRNEAEGAFFRIAEDGRPIWELLATDVQFGPDGAIYVSDWVDGWVGTGKGRIYRFAPVAGTEDPAVVDTAARLASDVAQVDDSELLAWLSHADRRVRMKGQLELARRGAAEWLQQSALRGPTLLARLHGLWGLDHSVRLHDRHSDLLSATVRQLASEDAVELRAHAIRLIGDAQLTDSSDLVRAALDDASPRVRYFALLSLGKLGDASALAPVLAEIDRHRGQDPALRHAGIMALAGIASPEQIAELKNHASPHVRLAAVVALRRCESPLVAKFLDDAQPLVAVEAACAIYDVPIEKAMSALAYRLLTGKHPEPFVRRALAANFRLGSPEGARRLAQFAAASEQNKAMRVEALKLLADWQDPRDRDPVLGMWRPLPPRDASPARDALASIMDSLSATADTELLIEFGRAANRLQLRQATPLLASLAANHQVPASVRAETLRALVEMGATESRELMAQALAEKPGPVKNVALELLPRVSPQQADELLSRVALSGNVRERQAAIAGLASLESIGPGARRVLQAWVDGQLPPEVHLEARELAEKFQAVPEVKAILDAVNQTRAAGSRLDAYREALVGGRRERGRDIFFNKVSVSCVRCHKVDGQGGEVGPDLSKIAADRSREYLLEAIVDPNKQIAKGFESAVVLDADGVVHTGVVREETDELLKLIDAEGKEIIIPQEEIESRRPSKSAMPEDILKNLSLRELRDLVEYLSTLDGSSPSSGEDDVL